MRGCATADANLQPINYYNNFVIKAGRLRPGGKIVPPLVNADEQ